MNARLFILLTVLPGVAAVASALPVIDVQTHCLAPDTAGQAIAITVRGGDMVRGFRLRAQIGDGLDPGAEPLFEITDFTGGIWDAHPNTITGGVIGGFEQVAQAIVTFDDDKDTAPANGVVVTLLLDTTGFSEGSFDLLLSESGIGEDSNFIVPSGDFLEPVITNGTIIISDRLPPGDADGDGAVGAGDLDTFFSQFGLTDPTGTLAANFNGDDIVDLEDLAILRGNFGYGVPSAPDASFAATAPEPATLLMLTAGLPLLSRRRRPFCHR